jgi:hypothetical protein
MNSRKALAVAGLILAMAGAYAAGMRAQTPANQRVVWTWPDSMDAQNAAPKNHAVLYQDDHIMLLEVTIQPGETEIMHGHKYPSVYAYDAVQPKLINHTLVDDARFNAPRQYEDHDWYEPACRTLGPEAPHQVTILDPFPQHFYRLEFKKMDGKDIEAVKLYPRRNN